MILKKNIFHFIPNTELEDKMATQFNQTQPELNQTQPETNQNEDNAIDYYYTEFKGAHLSSIEPKEKSFDSQNGKVNYKEVPIQYNYGTVDHPIIDSCFIECPEVLSYGGVQCERKTLPPKSEGDPPYLQEKYSMMFTFDLQNQECVDCLGKIDEMHRAAAYAFGAHKGKVGMYDFDPERPGSTFKNPLYYKRDQVTGERIKGRNPTLWVKLNHWKNNKTLFTDLNENPIDWSLLTDVEVKMIPLIHVEKIYVGGGKASLQLKLVSAVITDVAALNTKTRQTRTIDRLKKRKGLADTVASQLAQLRMEKQDTLDSGNFQPQNAQLPGSDSGSMHQIPSNSSGGYQGTQDQLNAYLGGAPAMNSSPPVQNTPIQLPTAPVPTQSQLPQSNPTNNQPTMTSLNVQPTAVPQQGVQFSVGTQMSQPSQPGQTVLQIN